MKNKLSKSTWVLLTLTFILIVGATLTFSMKGKSEDKDIEKIKSGDIKVVEQKEKLTLSHHDSIGEKSLEEMSGLPLTEPLYTKDLRVQVKEMVRGEKPKVVLEVGNTSNKEMKLDEKNMGFSLFDYDTTERIDGTKIENGPIVIQPNEVKEIVVTATNPNANVFYFSYGNIAKAAYFGGGAEISDVAPLTSSYMGENAVNKSYMVSGNGKFKYQAKKAILTDNTDFGGFNLDGKKLVLVKLQIANTSDEEMKINKVLSLSTNSDNGAFNKVEIPQQALTSLGEDLLSLSIPSHTIAEGYLPVLMSNENDANVLYVKSNLGDFSVQEVENLSLW